MCQVEIIFIRNMGDGKRQASWGRELSGKDLSVKMTLKQRLEERKGQRCRYRGRSLQAEEASTAKACEDSDWGVQNRRLTWPE